MYDYHSVNIKCKSLEKIQLKVHVVIKNQSNL